MKCTSPNCDSVCGRVFRDIVLCFQISRMLAAKAALAIRVDALGEDVNNEMGIEHRANVEMRLKQLEEGFVSEAGVFVL